MVTPVQTPASGMSEDADRPPVSATGAFGWIRQNLFNTWFNSVLTLLVGVFAVWAGWKLIDWAILGAVWGKATQRDCQVASGACWAFVTEKYRLILFGRYPFAEQWRPLLAMILLMAGIGVSCNRRFWRRELAYVWVLILVVLAGLMWGGFLGLTYVENTLWGGLPLTLILATIGIVASFPVAICLALGRRSNLPAIKAVCVAYIELIRGVPLVALLFMASFMFPLFLPSGVTIDALLRAQVAIIMFTSAYLAEVIRGGLQSIPKGQIEAAQSLGLSYWQTMRKIVLPQALRVVIPPMVNTFIALFKDTSLVAIVGLTDLLLSTRQALSDAPWRPFFLEAYVFIAAIYFVYCFFMSKYSQRLEARLRTSHRR
jgi:general L-amino acid transport system permease protein